MMITEALRNYLIGTTETMYRVAKDTGISWATLKRFSDGGGLRSDQMDKLAEYFELDLQPRTGSYAHLAKLMNISEDSIRVAEKVMANGIPEIADAVWKGALELSDAEKIASKPRDKQLELLRKALKRK